eukprot:245896-Chlamydomonas_euryale.AAC.1
MLRRSWEHRSLLSDSARSLVVVAARVWTSRRCRRLRAGMGVSTQGLGTAEQISDLVWMRCVGVDLTTVHLRPGVKGVHPGAGHDSDL